MMITSGSQPLNPEESSFHLADESVFVGARRVVPLILGKLVEDQAMHR